MPAAGKSPRRAARSGRQAQDLLLTAHAPSLRGNEGRYLRECLDSGWVSSAGPFVARLEQTIAAYTGARRAVATINGSAALHIALKLIGLQPDEEVLLPDLTFIAPFNVVRACGGHPVLLDVDARYGQLDPTGLERFFRDECVVRGRRCINRRSGRQVRAVVPIHLLGLACEIERIVALARRHHVAVIEDAAQAIGVKYRGRHVGTFGDVGILSFNGNKLVTAGGGGALLLNDPAQAGRAHSLTTHAKSSDRWQYLHQEVGFNYRLNNLQAAVGLAQMERLDWLVARQRAIAAAYERAFAGFEWITPMPSPADTASTYWLYTIQLNGRWNDRRRTALLQRLAKQGIAAQPLWAPLHRQPSARRAQRFAIAHAGRLYARSISLPSSSELRPAQIRSCAAAVIAAVQSMAW